MNSVDMTQSKPWWQKMFMVIGIIAILLFGYMLYLTYDYYSQIQSGAVDISKLGEEYQQTISTDSSLTGATATSENEALATLNDFSNDPTYGPSDARLTIVLFEDFECPYCAQLYPTIRKMMDTYGSQVQFVYRDFPLSTIHPNAQLAAEAAQCANDQGRFWEYHDRLFENQANVSSTDLSRYASQVGLNTSEFDNCLDSGKYTSEVLQDYRDGVSVGVTGTPTLFFNGNKLEGVLTEEGAEHVIQTFLQGNGNSLIK